MSLFEIEIHDKFKILNTPVFLDKEELAKLYKVNNLNDGYKDDISEYLVDDVSLNIYHDTFVAKRYRYEVDELSNIVKTNIYTLNQGANETIFYPEWILFYIATVKKKVSFIGVQELFEYKKFFEYIAEIRYKKYFIRNIQNFINYSSIANTKEIQESLHNEFIQYLNQKAFSNEELYKFLNFLYKFHTQLKENEKYKLMWNLETYMMEAMKLLLDNNMSIKDIYLEVWKNMRGTYSVLHEIHRYKPLYIEESKNIFQTHLAVINKVFNVEITVEELMNVLTSNEKYEDTLFSYIELIKRFNANKISEDVMSAMIKGVVLGLEEHIKDFIQEPKKFDERLETLCENKDLFHEIRLRIKSNDKNILLSNLNTECLSENKILETYLAIYYNARNYLAHYNIDMNKFFWGEDGQRKIISTVIDSTLIILYKLETMQEREE